MSIRCNCGAILKPSQKRCKDCSASMLETARVWVRPPEIEQWGESYSEQRERREYILRVGSAIIIGLVVLALAIWAWKSS